jgi:uridine kinase
MCDDVFNLKIRNSIYQEDYDHSTGKFLDSKKIESKDNIIVCGLHSLYIKDDIINLKIYMDTDDNLRIPWKIKRDIKKRGYSIEKILLQIKNRKHDFEKYILPQKNVADIIINFYTDKIFDLAMFNIDEENTIFLRIGIKKTYNITNILLNLQIKQMSEEYNFIYLYFDSDYNYDAIVKTIIKYLC